MPGTPDRNVDVVILTVVMVAGVAGLGLAVFGSFYCPTMTWVKVADLLTALVWIGVLILAIRYRGRGSGV